MLGTFVFLVLADQISKYIIRLKGGFYVCNSDVAFGIPMSPISFWIVGIGLVLIVGTVLEKELNKGKAGENPKNNLKIAALLLILGGALSNMLDRIALGCVMDFIDFKSCLLAGVVWPLFNLADFFIVFGAFLFLVKFRKM